MGLFHILKTIQFQRWRSWLDRSPSTPKVGCMATYIVASAHIIVGYNSCRYLRHILSSKHILSPATICADIDPSFLGLKGRQFIFNFELPNFIHSINFIYNKPVKQLWQQTFIACSVYDLKETYPKLQGICINRNFNDLDMEIIHFISETEFNNYVSLVK